MYKYHIRILGEYCITIVLSSYNHHINIVQTYY